MVKKIIYIVLLSLLFGIIQAYIILFDFKQIIASSAIPILISLPFFVIYSIYLFYKGRLKSSELIDNLWAAFKPIFILLIVVHIIGYLAAKMDKNENTTSDTDLHKSTVLKENKNHVKDIGEIESEILNKDNLYENFNYHYAILFPKGYKVDYGIGKYSQIQAYNEKNGNSIIITSFQTDKKIN
jgi:hypothetical protein